MIFDIVSDIHADTFSRSGGTVDFRQYWRGVFEGDSQAVALLIAGDLQDNITAPTDDLRYFFDLACGRYKAVYCVLGNHDYWTGRHAYPFSLMPAAAGNTFPGVKFLERESVELAPNLRLFGATWWSNINPVDEARIWKRVRDFQQIHDDDLFSPGRVTRLHASSVRDLALEMDCYPRARFVVLTHHAPSYRSADRPQTDELAQVFCSNDDALMHDYPQIALWVHGHIHTPADYRIGQTRVVSNPHGVMTRERGAGNPYRILSVEI